MPEGNDHDLVDLCRAFALSLREGERFSGLTAALLWGAPLAYELRPRQLHVTVVAPLRARRAAGVTGHKVARFEHPPVQRHGVAITDAASTWLGLAAQLPRAELISVGDYLVHVPVYPNRRDPRPFVALGALAERVRAYHGAGADIARESLQMLSTHAESRPETLLRLLLHDAGLPTPRVNPTILDRRGDEIGRADLVFDQWKVVVEYDGDQHRTNTTQYEKDMTRVEHFILDGWKVIRVRKHGLFTQPHKTVAHVASVLSSAGWTGRAQP